MEIPTGLQPLHSSGDGTTPGRLRLQQKSVLIPSAPARRTLASSSSPRNANGASLRRMATAVPSGSDPGAAVVLDSVKSPRSYTTTGSSARQWQETSAPLDPREHTPTSRSSRRTPRSLPTVHSARQLGRLSPGRGSGSGEGACATSSAERDGSTTPAGAPNTRRSSVASFDWVGGLSAFSGRRGEAEDVATPLSARRVSATSRGTPQSPMLQPLPFELVPGVSPQLGAHPRPPIPKLQLGLVTNPYAASAVPRLHVTDADVSPGSGTDPTLPAQPATEPSSPGGVRNIRKCQTTACKSPAYLVQANNFCTFCNNAMRRKVRDKVQVKVGETASATSSPTAPGRGDSREVSAQTSELAEVLLARHIQTATILERKAEQQAEAAAAKAQPKPRRCSQEGCASPAYLLQKNGMCTWCNRKVREQGQAEEGSDSGSSSSWSDGDMSGSEGDSEEEVGPVEEVSKRETSV